MRRAILLTLSLGVLIAMNAGAQSLEGRLGAGLNWAGVQVKYGLTEDYLGEVKVQLADNNTLVGVRGYRFFPEVPRMLMPVKPYLGSEFDWVFSEYVNGGVLGGVFGGLEMMPVDHIGIELDAGLYYQNLWSRMGSLVDLGIIINLGVTFFF